MNRIQLGDAVTQLHMIGIGGVSMSGLAEILWRDGYTVTGSDEIDSEATRHLRALGIKVAIHNSAENIAPGVDLVIYTAAVKPENPEYRAAQARGIPTIDRAALLALIMEGYAHTVCVAGSHGKTTTTSIIADTCLTAALDPTISVGGYMGEGFNFRVGDSPYFIIEACEYFDSFLQGRPYVGVILNIDEDHMDYFKTMERLISSFSQFAKNIVPEGALVIYGGTTGFDRVTEGLSCRVWTYGTEDSDFTAQNVVTDEQGHPSFDICFRGEKLTRVSLKLIGASNILNALACAAVCHVFNLPSEQLRLGLASARGVRRRYEYKGSFNGVAVVDDYAHHPTEIKSALSAARTAKKETGGRIICVFQPHTYSRTKHLLDGFASAFGDADEVMLLPIFASREAFQSDGVEKSVTSQDLVDKIIEKGQSAVYADSFDAAAAALLPRLMPGDLLITMGAGDVYILGEQLLRTKFSTLSTGSGKE